MIADRGDCLTCASLLDEFLTALQAGEPTDAAEFAARHPEHADSLLTELENVRSTHDRFEQPSEWRATVLQPPSALQTVLALQHSGELGRGGQAEVHLYTNASLDQEVAVKFPRGDRFSNADPGTRGTIEQRFWREAQIASRLDHPGVAPMFARGAYEVANGDRIHAGESQTSQPPATLRWPYYVMRRVAGLTLEKCVEDFYQQGGRLTRDNAAFLDLLDRLRKACETIAYAHQRGVLHRDLKPANIVVGDYGVTTVLDWGVARPLDAPEFEGLLANENNPLMSAEGDRIGTREFMSPEQAAGHRVDHRTDIYGLGGLLFQLLTSHSPHRNDTPYEDIVSGPTPLASQRRQHVPRELDSVCAKAMARDPEARYLFADEMERDLAAWLTGNKVSAHAYSAHELLIRWTKKNIAAVSSVALGCLALLIAIAVAAIWIGVAEARANSAETERREAVEAHRLSIETMLTQRELETAKSQLLAGTAASGWLFDQSKRTSSWDTRYMSHALAMRPSPTERLTTGGWGIVAATYDGSRRLAVAHGDGEVSVWDVPRRERVQRLAKPVFDDGLRLTLHYALRRRLPEEVTGQVQWCTGLAWLPGGERLVTTNLGGHAVMFDVATGESQVLFTAENPLWAVAATADGQAVLCGDSSGGVYRYAPAAGNSPARRIVAAGPSAVTVIAWHTPAAGWLIGDVAGRVQLLHEPTLESIASVDVAGPIWSLDAVNRNGVKQIAAADGKGRVAVFELDAASRKLVLSRSLILPPSDKLGATVSTIRFDNSGKRLWAIASDGSMGEWDVDTERFQWSSKAVVVDTRRREFQRQLRELDPPDELPFPFHRVGAAILDVGAQNLITAGDDGLLSFWSVPERGEALLWGTSVHEGLIGAGARLAFSATHQEHLWALDSAGDLVVANAATGKVVARRAKAHPDRAKNPAVPFKVTPRRQPPDLAVLPDSVVTAGGDLELRFWRIARGQLVPARAPIRHDRPLVGVAATADGAWVAAVDIRSGLGVWKVDTGERQFFDQLPGAAEQPYSGSIAFQQDQSRVWLAAFGARQSGHIFVCREEAGRLLVRRLPDQINVAGMNGGVTLAWNPAWPGRILYSDDFPRFGIRSFDEAPQRGEGGRVLHSTIVDMAPTPDGRRILSVDRDGLLVSLDARHELQMLQLHSSLRDVVGLSIDCQGRRVAIANEQGTVEFWHTADQRQGALSEPEDATHRWSSVDLLNRDSAVVNVAPRTLNADARGRAHFLMTESHPGDFRSDGALYYVAEDEQGVTRERITIGKPEFDRRMDAEACALHVHADQPVVVFRCRTAERSPYDGEFYLARRMEAGAWEKQRIHEHGNWGFYPAMMIDGQGHLTDVFHFSFGGYYLFHSHRSENGWTADAVGEHGDGLYFEAQASTDRLHLLTNTMRFFSDPRNSVYLQWSRGDSEPLRELLPPALEYTRRVVVLPSGQPVVMQNRGQLGATAQLMTRTERGWKEYQVLPPGLDIRDWDISRDGTTYLAAWQEPEGNQHLVLWRGVGDRWSGQIVGTQFTAPPNRIVIRCDPQGRPFVAAGRLAEPFSWFKVFRQRE